MTAKEIGTVVPESTPFWGGVMLVTTRSGSGACCTAMDDAATVVSLARLAVPSSTVAPALVLMTIHSCPLALRGSVTC